MEFTPITTVNRVVDAHDPKLMLTGVDAVAPAAMFTSAMGTGVPTVGVQAAPATWVKLMEEIVTPLAAACELVTFTVQTRFVSAPDLAPIVAVSCGKGRFVRVNDCERNVETTGSVAFTAKLPGTPFAVSNGAVATPWASVRTVTLDKLPGKNPLGPEAGAVNVTGIPGSGTKPWTVSLAANG